MKAEKTPIDPNKPLKNIRQEKFAREVAAGKTQTQAYQETYKAPLEQARSNAYAVMEKNGVRERVIALMERDKNLSLIGLNTRLSALVASQNENVALGSTKLAYQLHGALDPEGSTGTDSPIAIQINVLSDKPEKAQA